MMLASPTENQLALLRQAASSNEPVSGLTHRHYKYPARFSPSFVRAAVESFSQPGDVVFDPYVGGGTTLVESMALGRRSVGCDVNSLAVFVAGVKTMVLTDNEVAEVITWATEVVQSLSYHALDPRIVDVLCERRTRNMNLPNARPIKKFLGLALLSLEALQSNNSRRFARCILLNVTQWALDGRRRPVSLRHFRDRVGVATREMIEGTVLLGTSRVDGSDLHLPVLIHDSAENVARHSPFSSGQKTGLVVTSPPYPGVHVLYHRWQVDGRRETPAPYWIADCMDGEGESFYTFGSRKGRCKDTYFEQSLKTLQAIRSVMKSGGIIVQMIAFSNPRSQLRRYLANMDQAGFSELRVTSGRPVRTWRNVPGRNWHANLKGETDSAREVALVHVAV